MRTVYKLAGSRLLDPRARNGHVACRTAPVLNRSEDGLPAHSARPCQQSLEKRFRLRLLAKQSLAQDFQLLRFATYRSTCSGYLLHTIHLGFCCRHLNGSFIPPDLFAGFTAWIQLLFFVQVPVRP